MKNKLFILISFITLTGCAQNLVLLGPAISVATTGGIQQAIIGGTISHGIKNETGKNVSEHVISYLDKTTEDQECNNTHSNPLQEIFFKTSNNVDCKKIQ
jgi:hypothetical protein